jgi:ribonuclease P protein component
MKELLPKVIKKQREIKKTIEQGEKRKGEYLTLFVNPQPEEDFGFCVLVNKKIKKAVRRNRIKRILREIVRKNIGLFGKTNQRVVLLYNSDSAEVSYIELEDDFRGLVL